MEGLAGEPKAVICVSQWVFMLAAIEGSFLDCRNCEVALGSCADVQLRVLQPRWWDSEVPRTSSCREKVVCYCTRSEPASLKALLNFLLLQSWHLASFPANRAALLIGERLEVFEICLCGNEGHLSTCWEADIE